MPRNPNDVVPSPGQSSSQLGAGAAASTNNIDQQPPQPQSDITIQSGDNGSSSASQQPGAQVAATASSMGQLTLQLDEFHVNDESNIDKASNNNSNYYKFNENNKFNNCNNNISSS